MSKLIVTENPKKWNFDIPGVEVISAREYFANEGLRHLNNVKVINLCKSYQYQSTGYYVSLLAEARNHKVLPEVATIQDFRFPAMIKDDAQDFTEMIQKTFKGSPENKVEFKIYFGYTGGIHTGKLGLLLFNLFQSPILKVTFVKKEKWALEQLKPLNIYDLNGEERITLAEQLGLFLTRKMVVRKSNPRRKYDLAILVNPDDDNPPSNAKALQKFVKAAEKTGFNTEIITRNEYARLTQFDALFIRETTNVNNYTFRFAKKAESEGLVVIDDPTSILRCTNKVYLNELMTSNNIPVPKSAIISRDKSTPETEKLQYPFILKEPDGAFSRGVKKVSNDVEFKALLKGFFKGSELLIAQEFMPTPFDWRIGIMNHEPLYVCRYHMARNHWQIVNWKEGQKEVLGNADTIALEQAPVGLLQTALKATKLIGDGLYGVDVKEVNGKFYVIEVNDNPNIDAGVEDKILKNRLYERIMEIMFERVKMN
ncbi:MAG: glutathione synthase/RimK-type ligase-like ATP-grasp enzyme [Roseivirga sp.]|jgi:glutathione synthase/RimK-type ligase-like ATP-grasp enzyme